MTEEEKKEEENKTQSLEEGKVAKTGEENLENQTGQSQEKKEEKVETSEEKVDLGQFFEKPESKAELTEEELDKLEKQFKDKRSAVKSYYSVRPEMDRQRDEILELKDEVKSLRQSATTGRPVVTEKPESLPKVSDRPKLTVRDLYEMSQTDPDADILGMIQQNMEGEIDKRVEAKVKPLEEFQKTQNEQFALDYIDGMNKDGLPITKDEAKAIGDKILNPRTPAELMEMVEMVYRGQNFNEQTLNQFLQKRETLRAQKKLGADKAFTTGQGASSVNPADQVVKPEDADKVRARPHMKKIRAT